ncbi:hypothetical protein CYMTET_55799 [Cymbomonas tetramitiformis]|uniref:Uncharacterized protein n=1 Tax=Cymbomonas tetramitiformis TaxID=36881 RepID=A0AAE0BCK0_9CHLO|nr:hypothetical protein CYMTET_55799 [Cymbomonas tetramitiformis]
MHQKGEDDPSGKLRRNWLTAGAISFFRVLVVTAAFLLLAERAVFYLADRTIAAQANAAEEGESNGLENITQDSLKETDTGMASSTASMAANGTDKGIAHLEEALLSQDEEGDARPATDVEANPLETQENENDPSGSATEVAAAPLETQNNELEQARSAKEVEATPNGAQVASEPEDVNELERSPAARPLSYPECPANVATTFSELPAISGRQLPCFVPREYREWSDMVVALLSPSVSTAQSYCSRNSSLGVRQEVLVYRVMDDDVKQDMKQADAVTKACTGANQIVVHAGFREGSSRAINRLMRLASGSFVLLATDAESKLISGKWIEDALAAMKSNPGLALVGPGAGTGSAVTNTAELLHGPALVQRRAFLKVGQLGLGGCPSAQSDGMCNDGAMAEISARFWKGGYQVATLPSTFFLLKEKLAPPCSVQQPPHPGRNEIPGMMLWRAAPKSSKELTTKRHQRAVGCSSGVPPPPAECPGELNDTPVIASIVEFYKRSENIATIMSKLTGTSRSFDNNQEIIIGDDSRTDYGNFSQFMRGPGRFLVFMPNLHEIRAYNRLSKFSSATYLAYLQDDDNPPEKHKWSHTAVQLFDGLPKLGFLGGFRGRLDLGSINDPRHNLIMGPKYGPKPMEPSELKKCCDPIVHREKKSNVPFMYMYKVNAGPLIARRDVFLSTGMFHTSFSCAGEPGIGFDYEYSIRMWNEGYRTGIYYSGFTFGIGDSGSSGTHVSLQGAMRSRNELHNNLQLFKMFKIHHKGGTAMTLDALAELRPPKKWVRPTDKSAMIRVCMRDPGACKRELGDGNKELENVLKGHSGPEFDELLSRVELQRQRAERAKVRAQEEKLAAARKARHARFAANRRGGSRGG